MLVKYYDNPELAYTTRKRYNTFSFEPFFEEEQRSVLLGDGAFTSLKTSKDNICNYVTIDDTRWYVMNYVYINGGQVRLNLQRDVIGEFGLNDCYGKIERGYTDSILKNRKELSLNQILKERKQLKPNSGIYGNYTVDNHNDEMWGILYFVRPTELDPNTGKPYPEQVNINIPAFAPETVNYDFIENGTKIYNSFESFCSISFNLKFDYSQESSNRIYMVTIDFSYENDGWIYTVYASMRGSNAKPSIIVYLEDSSKNIPESDTEFIELAKLIGNRMAENILNNPNSQYGYSFPSIPVIKTNTNNYNNVVIKHNNNYYSYSTQTGNEDISGNTSGTNRNFVDRYISTSSSLSFKISKKTVVVTEITADTNSIENSLYRESYVNADFTQYNYTVLSASEAGQIVIDTSQQLIDEPYNVLVFPLFDVNIGGNGNYKISKKEAFMIFNTVIQYLSGENSYLVDAQIYPYCPVLTSVSTELNGYPFFTINSSSYTHYCDIQLLPKSDIKKEYIEREYSIISPEQSSKFTFNFYDYVTRVEDVDGVNYAKLQIAVKTALKPFAIISSAVIQPDANSLIGITYEADLRGSQPTSNGFECSLSSNAFETYKRQNSNYQQIFNLDKEELQKQHEVENVNNITSAVVNSVSAATMGAIAGASLADQIAGTTATRAIGGIAGAAVAGGTVAGMMGWQTVENQKIMEYEESLQQQRFDLQIGTIKNLPNSINRISSFNEIILKSFWYNIETYECSEYEKSVVDNFIDKYGYGIGVFDYVVNYCKEGWFLRSTLISSSYKVNLHQIAEKELMGGIYYYE